MQKGGICLLYFLKTVILVMEFGTRSVVSSTKYAFGHIISLHKINIMKVNKKQNPQGAFTLIELLIVIAIIGILAGSAMPAYNGILERAKRKRDSSNVGQILLACNSFAADWDGLYPSFDPDDENAQQGGGEDSKFSSSTDAFNVLYPQYVDSKVIFWIATKDPEKMRPPTESGKIEARENTYAYVSGLSNTSFSRSPLVADGLMEGPGSYNQYHPWLKSRKAIVGYCGGDVQEEMLTTNQPGATIRSKDGKVKDIFEERQVTGDDGSASGGWLDTKKDNLLLPK